ncbi:hypothetical protein [Bradyrhizobium lupini]|uniref:hypothetical protein n=1 Tax=Rhizobium lupini TaxID=136996 RepID=UPI0034C64B88
MPATKWRRKNRGVPPPETFDIDALPASSNLTGLEAAAVIRRTAGALEQWRGDPNHPLNGATSMAARFIVSMRRAIIWPRPLSRPSRIMLAETAEQLGLDGVERIRPLQPHHLTDPFRAD